MRTVASLAVLAFVAVAPCAQAEDAKVQSMLLRSVTVTCKLEESIAFYRDILGQEVMEDATQNGDKAAVYLDVLPTSKIRFVIMRGSAVYPGGEIIGGRIAFMGIEDPKAPACKDTKVVNRRATRVTAFIRIGSPISTRSPGVPAPRGSKSCSGRGVPAPACRVT